MATHAIGRNNALVGICVKKPAKAILGQLATEQDRSLASLIWHNAMENIRRVNPEMAAKIAAASVQLVFIAGILTQPFICDDPIARRGARGGRRREIECVAQLLDSMGDEEV